MENLVSTIIPVYNRSNMLREAVASVLSQTWRPIEIIIVDDGSSDDTVHVAEDMKSQHPEITHVLRQKNAGPGVARRLAVLAIWSALAFTRIKTSQRSKAARLFATPAMKPN